MNCTDETLQALERDRGSGSLGVDARTIECLTYIDIAEAGDDPLIEQQKLDRRASAGQPALQFFGADIERFRAKSAQRFPFVKLSRSHKIERPESARIIESNAPAIVGFNQEVVVFLGFAGIDPPAPGHSEMKHQSIVPVGVDEAVFGAPS